MIIRTINSGGREMKLTSTKGYKGNKKLITAYKESVRRKIAKRKAFLTKHFNKLKGKTND